MIEYPVGIALAEVPVNAMPLLDDTDFKTRETSVAFNASGMDLVWNFITPDGAATQTAVTPTTGGDYDWAHLGDGMYTIEIPASGGASINNNALGYGYFSGFATGVLPWRGPTIKFVANVTVVTTIATLSSQTSFTLTAGSVDDDAYNGWLAIVRDATGSAQHALGVVSDYAGDTKTVTLETDPGIYTMAVNDYITLIPNPNGLTVAQKADVNAEADGALSDYDPPTNTEMEARTIAAASYATATALQTVDNEIATIDGNVDSILEDTGTTLPATLSTIAGYIDTEVAAILADTGTTLDGKLDAIKAITDQLTFSSAGFVDANVMEVNDNGGLTGDGDDTPIGTAS